MQKALDGFFVRFFGTYHLYTSTTEIQNFSYNASVIPTVPTILVNEEDTEFVSNGTISGLFSSTANVDALIHA